MRALSTGEVSTALRPFYFTVHPDLFGQYPTQRVRIRLSANVVTPESMLYDATDNEIDRDSSLSSFVDRGFARKMSQIKRHGDPVSIIFASSVPFSFLFLSAGSENVCLPFKIR